MSDHMQSMQKVAHFREKALHDEAFRAELQEALSTATSDSEAMYIIFSFAQKKRFSVAVAEFDILSASKYPEMSYFERYIATIQEN